MAHLRLDTDRILARPEEIGRGGKRDHLGAIGRIDRGLRDLAAVEEDAQA